MGNMVAVSGVKSNFSSTFFRELTEKLAVKIKIPYLGGVVLTLKQVNAIYVTLKSHTRKVFEKTFEGRPSSVE